MPYFPAGELEQAVVDTIHRELGDKKRLKIFYDEYKEYRKTHKQDSEQLKEINRIEKAVEKKRREKKRILDLLVKDTIEEDDAKPLLQQAARDIQILESQLSEMRTTISSSFEFKSFEEFYKIINETLPMANSTQMLVDAFVMRVNAFTDHIHIILVMDSSRKAQKNEPPSDSCWVKVGVKEGN